MVLEHGGDGDRMDSQRGQSTLQSDPKLPSRQGLFQPLHNQATSRPITSDSEIPMPLSAGCKAPRDILLCRQVENLCYRKLSNELWPSRMSIRTEKTKGIWKMVWTGNQYFFWTRGKPFSLTNSCFKREKEEKKILSLSLNRFRGNLISPAST